MIYGQIFLLALPRAPSAPFRQTLPRGPLGPSARFLPRDSPYYSAGCDSSPPNILQNLAYGCRHPSKMSPRGGPPAEDRGALDWEGPFRRILPRTFRESFRESFREPSAEIF